MPGGDSITTTDTYSAAAEDESKKANVFRNTQAGFEALNLSPELMKALYEEMKFVRPSKFQSKILPMILTPPYKNLIALAPTCSGKTTCFLLGILSRVDPTLPAPQALCICPSIELAVQVFVRCFYNTFILLLIYYYYRCCDVLELMSSCA
ncbi:putative RNA helicase [Helianthus annuus]|nr:putative RNA helicase [Helianthus annuus]KAJ0658070.1 putative RNA helicase [Helianthus annuus]